MLSGSPPLAGPLLFGVETGGLRALFTRLRGVEEAVIELVIGGSDTDRREGSRGASVFVAEGTVASSC